MSRGSKKQWEEAKETARLRPNMEAALNALGYTLRRDGRSLKYGSVDYRIKAPRGVSGDYSALVFCSKPDGTWVVIDNVQRYGKLAYDAIGALRAFFNCDFAEAVSLLSSGDIKKCAHVSTFTKEPYSADESFMLPPKYTGSYSATFAYLQKRGMDRGLLSTLVKENLLYEWWYEPTTGNKPLRMAVFPIYNENCKAVGADSCSTLTVGDIRIKRVISGSDMNYGWHLFYGIDNADEDTPLYFCESAIDALSLLQLTAAEGLYVSLAGIKQCTYQGMLKAFGGKAVICTDNDKAGNSFAEQFPEAKRLVPTVGKDWNDTLIYCRNNGILTPVLDKQIKA